MSTHYEQSVQQDIERIRSKIHEMAVLAERALRGCLQALKERNRQLAYSVILRDQLLDEREKEVDRLALEFILRHQPVAGTLRFAYAAIKINSELERVGDYAESMARQILMLQAIPGNVPLEGIERMANLVIPMLDNAVKAFVTQDAELAIKTRGTEDEVDLLRHQFSADLVRMTADDQLAHDALGPMLNVINRFERAADQGRNICQEVLYMCTGEYAKHKGAEVYRLLFVDEHHACRSQMAEGIGNSLNQPKFVFASAGLDSLGVDPATVQFLGGKGIDISRHTSRTVEQVPHLDHYRIIVALADAAKRIFPAPPTKTVCLDWSVPDPSKVQGSPEEIRAAYETTYEFMLDHIRDLVEAVAGDEIN